jgi:alpha-1,2-mannosyltransferase
MFGAYIWMSVFFTRPHKEERFLYPIYPLILIGASITLNQVHLKLKRLSSMKVFRLLVDLIPVIIVLVHAALSVSRGLALYKNYYSSIQIYKELNEPVNKFASSYLQSKELVNVCVSKEWYRFPSSFFIPEDLTSTKIQKWRLAFLESDFKGQLPGYYKEKLSGGLVASTRHIDKSFNDENKEVKSRYLELVKCDFFLDTDPNFDDRNVHLYHNKKNTNTKWKTLTKLRFLDATWSSSSNNSEKFFRSFYVPFLYEQKVKFNYFKLRVRIP